MGIFDNVASSIQTKTTSIADYTWSELFPQTNARSGVAVNVDSSLRVTTVFACARVLAEGIAQLPICIYEEDDAGDKTEFKGPLLNILARRPNDTMTSFTMRESMTIHAVLTGNAYAYLGFGLGELQEIIPLVPGSVMVYRYPDWTIEYHVSDLAGKTVIVPNENILHLRGPSWNGYLGMEAIQLAREAIGLAIATEETHASLHANGAQPGGVLSVKGKLDAPARERLKQAWQAFQGGVANRFKTAVLDVDADWKPLSMTGVDSQHLETRRFQIEEICRALRVFPQMVMHTDKTSTFASAEAFFLSHVTHSLMPWVKRWQEALDHAFFEKTPNLSVKLSVNELLKGSAADRASFYMAALGGARGETAYMTRNEVRKLEGLNPIAGGDKLLMPPTPADPIAGPAAGAKPTPPAKSELLQYLLETKDNPNHDGMGRFSSGSSGPASGRLFHGSNQSFDKFDVSKAGSATDSGHLGQGLYFSTDKRVTQGFANTYEANVSLKNPLRLSMPDFRTNKQTVASRALGIPDTLDSGAITKAAKAKGHDGVILDYSPVGYNHQEVAVFDDKNISIADKYATGTKYNPDQPRDAHGRFGSGGDGATENHLLRVGATVAVQAIIGALKGSEGGLVGAAAGAAIGAAIAAFVEFGGANIVGSNIIALVGPHVLPDWAHEMLVDHHDNLGKSFHTILFDSLSDDDKKRFCLDTLPKVSPEMLRKLAEKVVAAVPAIPVAA